MRNPIEKSVLALTFAGMVAATSPLHAADAASPTDAAKGSEMMGKGDDMMKDGADMMMGKGGKTDDMMGMMAQMTKMMELCNKMMESSLEKDHGPSKPQEEKKKG